MKKKDNRASKSRKGEFFIRISLVCASFFLCLVLAEVALRLLGYRYTPMMITSKTLPDDWRMLHAFNDRHFTYDPQLIWRPAKNVYPLNGDGFRGAALSGKAGPGELRLFAIGDSNTLGWLSLKGTPAPNWPVSLEEYFDLGGTKLKVTNAGAYGYTTFQGARLLRELLPHEPDVVLVSYGCNDAHLVHTSDEDFIENTLAHRFQALTAQTARSRTFQLLSAGWDTFSAKGNAQAQEQPVHRVELAAYVRNLEDMVAQCNAGRARCILLTRPYLGNSEDPGNWMHHAPRYYEATKETAKKSGADLIDVYAHFKDKPEFFVNDSHYSEAGHAEAARFISGELEKILSTQ